MRPSSVMIQPRPFEALLALGLLTSIAFAIAASVVSSVARGAPPPQCPAGTVLNVQTHACVPVKPPTTPAPTLVLKAPVTAVHLPVNSGKPTVTCNGHGSVNSNGSCICNTEYSGASCNTCAINYYGYPACQYSLAATTCSGHGSVNPSNGSCICDAGYSAPSCNSCTTNYYGYPACQNGR